MSRPARHGSSRARTPGAAGALAATLAGAIGAVIGLAAFQALPTPTSTPAATQTSDAAAPAASVPAEDAVTASPSPSPEPPEPVRFTLVAAGDVLPHTPVNRSAAGENGYDYSPLMAALDPYVSGADLAFCHLEVPVTPEGSSPSGYPLFSSPPELVRDLAEAGWDGCSTASNHTVDKGVRGVEATLAALDANGLQHAGSARTAEEAAETSFYTVSSGDREIRVAQISFSYGTNGMPVADPWEVNLFDAEASDAAPIIAAAEQARADGADVVVASVHCCVEYRTEPTDAQRLLAERIAESGAVDLYVGHHAHVPQPIELLPGGPAGEGMWTAFGLGNYLSNQSTLCCVPQTSNGVVLTATFTVDPDDAVQVAVEWTAITVDRADSHTMHVLTDIPDGAGTLGAAEVQRRWQMVRDAVGDEAPERTSPAQALAEASAAVLTPAA
ncbi:CapA family protein [Demequina lignilytica]|uniref:CapA family protein n=1 Tax=Demequina lignilytica TaxID=3051663 RepID=A0AB35MJN6_9MICO|nr:CapA family protein [Demequina sp. SYSU T0a273]MDN4483999.1 CapA family protein [Demequina sp. SYSU T0a273]